ncbi:MAG TPA: carboxypeptidase-like regulatory domain-containing protein, partial [Pyrinomonadaceae bacterium]|nr:carboxypeptidase-like regulatory domain-containing protein [Pyrinomonadaceae bacterium]
LRSLPSAEPGSRIYGQVAEHTISFKEPGYSLQFLQNIKVTVEGNGQTLEVLTDSEGRYEFKGVPQGTYRLRAELPSYLSYDAHAINISGRGCVPLDIAAQSRAKISGKVEDVNGKSLVQVRISLVPADEPLTEMLSEDNQKDRPKVFTTTDQQGAFSFSHLPPGRYLLVINRAEYEKGIGNKSLPMIPRFFYPGVSHATAATVIVVSKDDKTKTYDFHLPIN